MDASAGGAPLPTIQGSTPTTGQSVTVPPGQADTTVYLTPAGTLAALTVSFPADSTTRQHQTITIATTQTITALTLSGPTFIGGVATLAANAAVSFRKVASGVWVRVA